MGAFRKNVSPVTIIKNNLILLSFHDGPSWKVVIINYIFRATKN